MPKKRAKHSREGQSSGLFYYVEESREMDCPDCNGTGYDPLDGGQCDRCNGTGIIDRE